MVLHLAQSEEGVEATATHPQLRAGLGAMAGATMDDRAAEAVRLERAAPAEVFARWQRPGRRRWPRNGRPTRTSRWNG